MVKHNYLGSTWLNMVKQFKTQLIKLNMAKIT